MAILLEDPTPILVVGILAEAVLGVILARTRRGVLLWPMGGVLALVVIGVVVERLVVTERERVEAAIYGAADAVENNDRQRVKDFLSRSAPEVLRRALSYMDRVRFTSVSVRGLKVRINDLTSPRSAEATFTARADFTDQGGEYPYNTYAAQFLVKLVFEDGTWKVYSAEDDNLSALMRDVRW